MTRILLIEGYEYSLEMMRDALEAADYAVDSADSLADALTKAQPTPPHLIVCDWQLTDGDGADVIEKFPGIKTVMLTTFYTPISAQMDVTRITALVTRPYRPDLLMQVIRAALTQR